MQTLKSNLPKCPTCPVRSSALFGHLDTESLDKVRGLRTSQLLLGSGEHLYEQGETATTACTLYDGWMMLYRITHRGERQILRFAVAGDFLGYKPGKGAVYDHSAQALSPVKVCTFPIKDILASASQVADLLVAVQAQNDALMELCHSSLTAIANKSAEAKVAFLFLTLYSRATVVRAAEDNHIAFPLTQEHIGDALGLTSIHVNRVVQGLRAKGLIMCQNRCLSILDQEALIKVADMDPLEVERFIR